MIWPTAEGQHCRLLLHVRQEGKKGQTLWEDQNPWRETTCTHAGGALKGYQVCFLQVFFTAFIGWQGEVLFAMRCLRLGLCFGDRLGRPCFSFPSDCRGRQWSFVLASEARHEPKPLPLLLIPAILNKETKMSLKHVDMTGTCLHWVSPGNSQLVSLYTLLHCTTLGKIRELPLAL